jgi:hypothetical protein
MDGRNADAVDLDRVIGIERIIRLHHTAHDDRRKSIDADQFFPPMTDRNRFLAILNRAKRENAVLRDHDKRREVNRVHAFTQNCALASALATMMRFPV